MSNVQVTVKLPITVGNILNNRFQLTSCICGPFEERGSHIGLLETLSEQKLRMKPRHINWIQKLLGEEEFSFADRLFFGVLWFDNAARDASEKHWVLEVYGTEIFGRMQMIGVELSNQFSVSINTCLISHFTKTAHDFSTFSD
jgi:hypothetical protein